MSLSYLCCHGCGLNHNVWYKSYILMKNRVEKLEKDGVDISKLTEINKIFCLQNYITKPCCILSLILSYK